MLSTYLPRYSHIHLCRYLATQLSLTLILDWRLVKNPFAAVRQKQASTRLVKFPFLHEPPGKQVFTETTSLLLTDLVRLNSAPHQSRDTQGTRFHEIFAQINQNKGPRQK